MAFKKLTAEEAKTSKAAKASTPTSPTVQVTLLENRGNTAAMVSLKFGGFLVSGIAVIWAPEKQKFFISFPSRKTTVDGKVVYKDICFPTTRECREEIYALVKSALEEADPETEWNF